MAPSGEGRLAVGDGHELHWEQHGDPGGKPAVVLHGGPGSGAAPWMRDLFDLTAWRVVLFDQRGCGRSTPYGGLHANTTHHLVADIERLRAHLGIDRWLVLGDSWGSTLALAYAHAHPRAVTELVLFSVVTTTRREIAWVTRDVGRHFPEEWERFSAGLSGDLAAAYNDLLLDPDPAVHEPAARRWCEWEATHVRTHPEEPPDPRYDDPAFRLCFARIVTHYWRHAAWLEDDALSRGVPGVPCVLIHGRRDLSSPLDVPWRLARTWEGAELVIVDDEGHRGGAGTTGAILTALRGLAPPPGRR